MQCVSAEIHASAGKKAPANKLVAAYSDVSWRPRRTRSAGRASVLSLLCFDARGSFSRTSWRSCAGPGPTSPPSTRTLRALLAEPRYCARVKASIYEELVDLYKERLAAAAAAASDDADDAGASREGDAANRTAQIFLELLRRCPHDMSPRGELHAVVSSWKRARGAGGREPAGRTPARHSGAGAQRVPDARRGGPRAATTLAHSRVTCGRSWTKRCWAKPREPRRAPASAATTRRNRNRSEDRSTRDSARRSPRPAACCWRSAGSRVFSTRCAASPRRWSARSPRSPRRRRRISTGATAMRRSRWSRARGGVRARGGRLRRAVHAAGRGGTLDEFVGRDNVLPRGRPLGMSGRSATGWTRAVVVGTATMTGSPRARDEEDSRAKTSSSSTRTTEKIQPSR